MMRKLRLHSCTHDLVEEAAQKGQHHRPSSHELIIVFYESIEPGGEGALEFSPDDLAAVPRRRKK
jgi:hypothetical protein